MRNIGRQTKLQCKMCSNTFYGSGNALYCIDCKVERMQQLNRDQDRKRRKKI